MRKCRRCLVHPRVLRRAMVQRTRLPPEHLRGAVRWRVFHPSQEIPPRNRPKFPAGFLLSSCSNRNFTHRIEKHDGIRGCFADLTTSLRVVPSQSIYAGEMAEWLKAHAWKACLLERVTWVRIPLSPPVPLLSGTYEAPKLQVQVPLCNQRSEM